MITRNFKICLNAGTGFAPHINANQYDSGETWVFELFTEAGIRYIPASGAIIGLKADGKAILNNGSVDSEGRVVITETEQMTAAAGRAVYELLIDNNTHGTANFVVKVEERPTDEAEISDSDLSLIQQAIDSTNPEAIAEGVSDWMEEHLTPTTPVVDDTLTVSGAAADAKATGDRIAEIEVGGDGLTLAIKSALLQIAQKVAYIDSHGQDYYDDLYDALYPAIVVTNITLNQNSLSFGSLNTTQQLIATTTPRGGAITWTSSNPSVATVSQTGLVTSVSYGNATITATSGSISASCSVVVAQATVTSIMATYAQSGTVYSTDSLDSLKNDLVVTATWSNGTTSTVADNDYTLSGTLEEGTSTITVTYSGKTTTFNVTVSADDAIYTLTNTTFANANPVDTGINPFESSDTDISIVCDADFAGQQSGKRWVLFNWAKSTSPYPSINARANNDSGGSYMNVQWMRASNATSDSGDIPLAVGYVGNVKLVYTHAVGSGTMDYYVKVGNNTVIHNTLTSPFTAINTNIAVGGNLSGQFVFNGTVNLFKVYNKVLSQSDITSFMG